MDNEARLLLDDVISCCERDGVEERLIQMLKQIDPTDLTEDSLTLEAPSRFACAYLEKHRTTIETYLEEITFCPMAFVPTFGDQAAHTVSPAAPAQPTVAAPQTPAPVTPPAPTPQESVVYPSTTTVEESFSAEEAEPTIKSGITNSISPEDFQRLLGSMNDKPSKAKKKPVVAPSQPVPTVVQTPEITDQPTLSRFTFDTFVNGIENRMAYNSAIRFAAFAAEPGTNDTLFIYGHSGLGKTHLLMAIKNQIETTMPELKVKYANSQKYIDDYIREVGEAKKSNRSILQDYHNADVLIIDDIQNIIGKQASIDQFFQLVDEFIRSNKKIAIAADRAPKELELDERLTSRFNAGMLCLVSEPGFELKYSILKRYYEETIQNMNMQTYSNVDTKLLGSISNSAGNLSDEQIRYMAEISGNNIRELESFCERCAHDSLDKEQMGEELNSEDIRAIADQYFDTAQKVIRIATVQNVVEEFYGITHEEMVSGKRNANIAAARHMAVYLSYKLCEVALKQIGEAFGGRDHSTVLNSVKVIEKKMASDSRTTEDYRVLRNKIRLRS